MYSYYKHLQLYKEFIPRTEASKERSNENTLRVTDNGLFFRNTCLVFILYEKLNDNDFSSVGLS